MDLREQVKQDIAQQLHMRDLQKQKEYEDFLREKRMIDEIVTRIHHEDQK